MTAIYKRELKSYFHSMIGWIFIGVTIALMGVYFMAINLSYGYSNISYMLSSVLFLFIITIPLLSMRSLAEERKTKTDQLTLTAPVTVGKIVAGKYLAMVSILGIVTLFLCLLPLLLSFWGNVPYGESYTAILGYFLYGCACLAVGLFISSLTESQVIAAVVSILVFFVTYMMSGICSLISSSGNVLTTVLAVFDFTSRFQNFLNGTLDLTSVFYFLTVIVLALFFTVQSIQKRRFSISTKNLSLGAYSSTMMIVLAAVAVFANLMINELPSRYTKLDVTSEKLYALTDTTKNLLQNLEEDITIYVLQSESSQDSVVGETLKRYEESTGRITVEYRDPLTDPSFYKQYTDDNISMNSLIVVGEKRYQVINYSDMYETEFDYSTYSTSTTGYDGEGQITSAIDYVTREEMPVAYAITGHDEQSLDSSFSQALTKANLSLEEISLLHYDEIPEDAEFVMIMAPTSDFSSDDADKILTYVENGGKLFMVTAADCDIAGDMPNLQKILDYFNVTVEPGLIFEGNANYYYQVPFYLLPEVNYSEYTSDFYSSKYIFMPYAQAITVEEDDDVSYTSILSATEDAYIKQNIDTMTTYDKEEGNLTGPFDLAVFVEKTTDTADSQLFLFGSEALFTDSADQIVSGTNLTLFNNSISSYISEQEGSVSVPVKSYEEDYLTVSQGMVLLWGAVVILMIPLALLAAGLIIWIRRRKK